MGLSPSASRWCRSAGCYASANLEYAAVWGTVGTVTLAAARVADNVSVGGITTLLEPAGRATGTPMRLGENVGVGFQGCIVLGMGFVLNADEAQEWIAADARNAEVLFPYLNGEDLNSRPDASASRWVIDFNDRIEQHAQSYRLPYERLVERVKSERATNNRRVYRDYWWQYAEKRPKLRRAIAPLSEVLVIALVSKTVMPMRVFSNQVFSHMLGVFATDDYGDQAVLSSSLHQLWAITYGSTLETRVRYTPSDVFETFPRPSATARLAEVGRDLDLERREVMARRNLGLTRLYNLVNDPAVTGDTDVDRMRELHVEIDIEVVSAFGWEDVPLGHGIHRYRQVERWGPGPEARAELLDRLLLENQARADSPNAETGDPTDAPTMNEATLFD